MKKILCTVIILLLVGIGFMDNVESKTTYYENFDEIERLHKTLDEYNNKLDYLLVSIENDMKRIERKLKWEEEQYKRLKELSKKLGGREEDIEYIKYLIEIENLFELKRGELIALASVESSFRNISKVEWDGIMSYGVFQMRKFIAEPAYKLAVNRGIKLERFDIEIMKRDKKYQALLAGAYLNYLHKNASSDYEVWAWYNAGIQGKEKFKDNGYRYPYSEKMAKRIKLINDILEDYYIYEE